MSMDEQKSGKLNAVIIALVAVIGFIVALISFIWRLNSHIPAVLFAWVCVYYGFVLYYGVRGYKKPHGNMVRYLMLILAVYIAAATITPIYSFSASWPIVLSSMYAVLFMAYMAGRLNKVKKNRYVAILVTVLLLVRCFWPMELPDAYGMVNLSYVLDRLSPLFMWLTTVLIYFFRYHEHREAGLAVDGKD